jgi:hydroxymethylpyrimidine kinase/phosphomethylpyrimidine kinase/thiamine-phosphate diphosphorylase
VQESPWPIQPGDFFLGRDDFSPPQEEPMIEGLYLITPQGTEEQILSVARSALLGGAKVIQYRDKERSKDTQIALARRLGQLCKEMKATFLINDSAEIAVAGLADGVHLGQGDMAIQDARKILGPNKLIGLSTRTVDQALKAEMYGADYIAVGSMFQTTSKSDIELVGLDTLRKVRRAVKLPIVAIGGIDAENGADTIDAGADALAIISAIANDRQPTLAARELTLLFNRRRPKAQTRVMTVAGSDPGGGAGIQADLKTITLLGSYGTSVITVLTAQNTCGVQGISPASAAFILKQMDLVLTDIGTDTLKTGMLYSAEIVEQVAGRIAQDMLPSVVDPVMIAKGGAPLLKQEAVEAFRTNLLPHTFVLTPNIPEAEALTGLKIETLEEMESAALSLNEMGVRHVLMKGGHRSEDATDILLTRGKFHRFTAAREQTGNTHGTGCTYSAALATLLAQGQPLLKATENSKQFISHAIRNAYPIGSGHGPVNHFAGAKALAEFPEEN